MADIVLFRPPERPPGAAPSRRGPLGLVCAATPLLEKGFSVRIIDSETSPDWRGELKMSVGSDTLLAGVGAMTGWQLRGALEFARAVKDLKDIPVVWGGLHPSFLPEQTLRSGLADAVVIGEGEEQLLQLVERVSRKESLAEVSRMSSTGFLDMDRLPTPAYELLDMDYYLAKPREAAQVGTRMLDLNVARGCPFRCAFCYNIQFNQRRWRAMSAARIVEHLEALVPRYRLDSINFVADNLFVDLDRVRAVCQAIVDRGWRLSWHSDIRVDAFLRCDDALLSLMKKSGCAHLTFGIESGSEGVLGQIHKDLTVSDVLKAHRKALDSGFKVNYHFMTGFPDETPQDIRETLRLIRTLSQDRNATIYGPSIYVPYPGTPLYDRCRERGFLPPEKLEDWISYDWDQPSHLPFFTAGHKAYLHEASHIAMHASDKAAYAGFLRGLYVRWCRLRLSGLLHGIRLFNADVRLALWLNSLRRLLSPPSRP